MIFLAREVARRYRVNTLMLKYNLNTWLNGSFLRSILRKNFRKGFSFTSAGKFPLFQNGKWGVMKHSDPRLECRFQKVENALLLTKSYVLSCANLRGRISCTNLANTTVHKIRTYSFLRDGGGRNERGALLIYMASSSHLRGPCHKKKQIHFCKHFYGLFYFYALSKSKAGNRTWR